MDIATLYSLPKDMLVKLVSTIQDETAKKYEIEMKRAMIDSSLERILLVDSSKFDKVSAAHYAELSDISAIITDKDIPPDYVKLCKKLKIVLHIA